MNKKIAPRSTVYTSNQIDIMNELNRLDEEISRILDRKNHLISELKHKCEHRYIEVNKFDTNRRVTGKRRLCFKCGHAA